LNAVLRRRVKLADIGLDEDKVKLIVTEAMNSKVVYRDYCIERHKEVDTMKNSIEKLESRLSKVYTILIMTLASALTNLLILLLRK
jgi:hypothetical protein